VTIAVQKSDLFTADVAQQFSWYHNNASDVVAWRFFAAVDLTVSQLAREPNLGRVRHFRHPQLQNLRSFRVEPPFQKIQIFYRITTDGVQIWRLMHGARDLPRRLAETQCE
jgi:toxin ParE1/3/4